MKKVKLRKQSVRVFELYPDEEIFNEWLKENIHRFNHKPVLHAKLNSHYVYGFEGIIGNITLNISFGALEASLYLYNLPEFSNDRDGTSFDLIDIEYIGEEKYHPLKGYYDADRVDHKYDYFPTQKELYINNVFEPIIEYCNKMFVSENSLELIATGGFSTAGCIRATEKIDSETLDFTHKFKDIAGVTVLTFKEGYTIYKYDLFCI